MSYTRQGLHNANLPRIGDQYIVNGAKAVSRWNNNADEEMYNM